MLLGSIHDLSDAWVISRERGQLLADEFGIKFMVVSAKASINVEEVSHIFNIIYLHGVTHVFYIV